MQVRGMVYGQAYQSGLNNPLAKDIIFIQGYTPYIEWKELEKDEVAINIDYTTEAGVVRRVRVTKGATIVSLPGYKQLTEVAYQTQHLPEQNALDTFVAQRQIIPFLTLYANHTSKNIIEKSGLVNRVISQSSAGIHPDVEYTKLQFENGSGATFSLFALRLDMSKGNTSLTTLMPDNATQFGLQTVKTMAERRDAAGGKIIAAVNADFFDWSPVAGRPWGPVVVEEAVVKNFMKEGTGVTSYFGVKKDGSLAIDWTSSLSAADYNSFSNMTGGGTNLLYLRGVPQVYNDVVREPRTMIGYTSDKKVYLVLVDGRQPGYSVGMTIDELIAVMTSLGIYSATNLDGGGSSTMVLKNNEGAFEVVNRYSDVSPRAVANAIAIKLK
ncbi:phosphodiester glycosidase family protein [Niabella hibiscisoli]|uniref:phosphodiester glycosidase family protein n=1 Tax=Niabella hibiscisoli TaxID=1825928 RepID=UPI00293EBCD7|nr:phosphodiester glycosidase family protein [Niabella hibiscisoli]